MTKRYSALNLTAGAAIVAGMTLLGVGLTSNEPVDAPATQPVEAAAPYEAVATTPSPIIKPAPTKSPAVKKAKPSPRATPSRTRTTKAIPSTQTTKRPTTTRTIRLSPVTALYSQSTIDRGKLVTWMTSPTCLLAGHDNMGWAWLDNVATGTIIKVTTGPCTGTYKVTGHKWQSVKGGPIPAWMSNYDLVLQTCTGKSGMGFSVAQRVAG